MIKQGRHTVFVSQTPYNRVVTVKQGRHTVFVSQTPYNRVVTVN